MDALGLPSGVVRLVPPDPSWPGLFTQEQERLRSALGDLAARIEHVGSTAIAAMPAKPILDLLIGRPPASALPPYVRALVGAGYRHRGENGLPGREYFIRERPDAQRTHHLHLVVDGGAFWQAHLTFRDYLRRVPERAAAYAALKAQLTVQFAEDREGYTDGKAAFVAETLRLARAAAGT